MKFFRILRHILIQVGAPLFILTALGSSLDRLITVKMEDLLMSTEGTSPWIWVFGFCSLVLNLIYPLMGVLLVLSSLQTQQTVSFLKKNFQHSLIELMRSWGSAMLWSLAFLIPGLIRWTQFLLVPFVVCFDSNYQRGDRDALQAAKSISRGHLFQLFMIFIFFSIVIPLFMTGFDEWKLIWVTPLPALLICFVEMLFNICFILCLWNIFKRSLADESVVSMEGHSDSGSRPHL